MRLGSLLTGPASFFLLCVVLFRFNPLDLQKHALTRKKLVGLSDLEVNQRLLYDLIAQTNVTEYQETMTTTSIFLIFIGLC